MKCILKCEDINNVICDDVVLELDSRLNPNFANINLYNREIDEKNKQYLYEQLKDNDICILKSKNKNVKNIIVIKTPDKFDFNIYGNLYEKIIKLSIGNNSKSLALTLLGACKQEFPNFEDSIMIFKMVKDIFKSNLKINLLFYYVKKNVEKLDYNNNTDSTIFNKKSNNSFVVINKNPINTNQKQIKYDSIDFAMFMSSINKNDLFNPDWNVTNPSDFIYDYVKQHHWTLQDKVFPVLNKNEHSRIRIGLRKMKKETILKYAIYLALNRSDFIQLLIIAGYSLSPLDPLDIWFYEYYNDEYYKYINPNQPYRDFCIRYYDDFDVIKNLLEEEI